MPDQLPPQPWHVEPSSGHIHLSGFNPGCWTVYAADGSVVCDVPGGPHAEALARLLAAAPRLAVWCEQAVVQLNIVGLVDHSESCYRLAKDGRDALAAARPAGQEGGK